MCYGTNGGKNWSHVVTVYRDFEPSTPYKICDKATGYCLAASNATAGSQIVKAAYSTTNNNQKWLISQTSAGSFKYKITNVGTGMVLDMAGSKTVANTPIVQAVAAGTATQAWTVKPIQNGTGFFQIQIASTTLNAIGTSTGNNMQLEAYNWTTDEMLSVNLAN